MRINEISQVEKHPLNKVEICRAGREHNVMYYNGMQLALFERKEKYLFVKNIDI